MEKNLVLVSGAILFKDIRGGRRWMIAKHTKDDDWEFPKVVTRRVESSVRASIRMLGEQGGMSVQVLEEVGRAGGVTTINGKTLPQRHIYYLITLLSTDGEPIGFEAIKWQDYAKTIKMLTTKREKSMLRQARKTLTQWQREQKKLQI